MPKRGTPTSEPNVEHATEVPAEQPGLPEGPNVGPSPQEHLAAQGRQGVGAPVGTGSGTISDGLPRSAEPDASPEEQELVDEQINRDRQASKSTDPSMP